MAKLALRMRNRKQFLHFRQHFRQHCCKLYKMPKKKTGQRKKAEKQRRRQKEIRSGAIERPLAERPCNAIMVNVANIWPHI